MANPTDENISRVVAGYNRAVAAADYADTIVCQMQQVSGDNYQMLWSTEYTGPFEPNKEED